MDLDLNFTKRLPSWTDVANSLVWDGDDTVLDLRPYGGTQIRFDDMLLEADSDIDGADGEQWDGILHLTVDDDEYTEQGLEVPTLPATAPLNVMEGATDGNDSLTGTGGADVILGGDGDDLLMGKKGSDYLRGESGDDELRGGGGNDALYGEKGDDRLYGNSGDDYIRGGADDDYLNGGGGNDTLDGGKGQNYLHGGAGDDIFMVGRNDSANVEDFTDGEDKLDVTELGMTAADVTAVIAAATSVEGEAALDFTDYGGGVYIFENYTDVSQLQSALTAEGDFIL